LGTCTSFPFTVTGTVSLAGAAVDNARAVVYDQTKTHEVSLARSLSVHTHTDNPKRSNTRMKRRRRPPRVRAEPPPMRILSQKYHPRPARRHSIALARSPTRRASSRTPESDPRWSIRSIDRIRTVPKTARSPRSATRVAIARRGITNEEKSLLHASTVVGSSRDVAHACGDGRATRARARGSWMPCDVYG